jgi:hypothetical protein
VGPLRLRLRRKPPSGFVSASLDEPSRRSSGKVDTILSSGGDPPAIAFVEDVAKIAGRLVDDRKDCFTSGLGLQ